MPLRTRSHWFGVVLDAPDAVALAEFYARLLGWQIFGTGAGWRTVAPSADAGYNLGFQTEQRYVRPVWPAEAGHQQMSMHLDLEVDDLTAAVDYAVSVGAELAPFQPQETVRVLLD